MHDPSADPIETLEGMIAVLKWPVVGILLFAFAWVWSLGSSYLIVQQARETTRQHIPPPL
jgi:hypothetical protein